MNNFVGGIFCVGRGVNVPVPRFIGDDFVAFVDGPAVGVKPFFYIFVKRV